MDLSTERRAFLLDILNEQELPPFNEKDIPALVMKIHKSHPNLTSQEIGQTLEQIILRRKAQDKFENPYEMLFLRQSLEQSTHWKVAEYIVTQIPNQQVVDLTSGIGGDAIQFAKKGLLRYAVEKEESIRELLQFNLRKFAGAEVLSSWDEVKWEDVSIAYLDPSRRDKSGNVLGSIEDWQPNLIEVIPALLQKTPQVVIKISPAFRNTDLELLPQGWSLEVISYNGELKQGILWYGFDKPDRIVTMITDEETYRFSSNTTNTPEEQNEDRNSYLFLPHAALRRAGLEKHFTQIFDLQSLAHSPKLLQGKYQKYLNNFGRWYELEETIDGTLGDLKRHITTQDLRQFDAIFLEKVSLDTKKIYQKTKSKEGGERVVFFANGQNGKYHMILAKRKRGD